MEEDLKTLEKLIENYKITNVNMLDMDSNNLFKRLILKEEQVHIIENLIKGYRELEKSCRNCVVRDILNDYIENSIPKSKVKEKIEEFKNKFDMGEQWYTKGYIIEVLQELMEE